MKEQKLINNIIPNRLDIIVKILYIESYLHNKDYAFYEELYKKHIRLRIGSLEDDKKNIQDFISDFQALILSIKKNGYDTKYPISVNKKGELCSGAHRLACCIFFNTDPEIIESSNSSNSWGYDWFQRNNFSLDERLKILSKYQSLFGGKLIIWYHYKGNNYTKYLSYFQRSNFRSIAVETLPTSKLGQIIGDIYSYNSIKLDENIEEKIFNLQKHGSPEITFHLVDEGTYNELKNIKQDIRKNYTGREKYRILHSPDSEDENQHLIDIFLSHNNLQHIEIRSEKPYRKKFLQRLDALSTILEKHRLTRYCIVGSGVIEVFQKFSSSDIDIITLESERDNIEQSASPIHLNMDFDIVSKNYGEIPEQEIITNPDYHFFFRGKKFINLELLKIKKLSGIRTKDIQQVQIIDSILNKKIAGDKKSLLLKKFITHTKYLYIRLKIYTIRYAIWFTKKIGIYKQVSYLWRKYFLRK